MQSHHNLAMGTLLASSQDELLIYQDQWSKVRWNHRHVQQADAG